MKKTFNGQAHFFLRNYDEAHAAYTKALELAPNDELIAQVLISLKSNFA
jgi:tetratricopeptide (TPR) repeat protein